MSGGLFDYQDCSLKNTIFDYSDTPTNVFEDREISELVWDVLNLIHMFDYYKSGDTVEENYLKQKAAFKKKWLNGNHSQRVKRIVDNGLAELKKELYKTYGLEDEAEHES